MTRQHTNADEETNTVYCMKSIITVADRPVANSIATQMRVKLDFVSYTSEMLI